MSENKTTYIGLNVAKTTLASCRNAGIEARQRQRGHRWPHHHDSGKFKGKRFVAGGRPYCVKPITWLSWSPVDITTILSAFYQRLFKAGKASKLTHSHFV